MEKRKVLVIVAHPDDETIWMGGTLLRNKNKWDITIISLCRADDFDRAPKFKRICEIYNARSFISNLDDEKLNPVETSEIINKILKFADKEYDYIFTHGSNGEYGHIRHKGIHKAVREMIKNKDIKCRKLFFFDYIRKKNDYQGYCIYNSIANKLINLNKIEFLMKKQMIMEIYGYQKGGFEEKSCGKIETFDTNI